MLDFVDWCEENAKEFTSASKRVVANRTDVQ